MKKEGGREGGWKEGGMEEGREGEVREGNSLDRILTLLSFSFPPSRPPSLDTTSPPPLPPAPPLLSIFEKALLLSLPPTVGEDIKAEEARLRAKGDTRWRAMVKQLVEVRREGGRERRREGGLIHITIGTGRGMA